MGSSSSTTVFYRRFNGISFEILEAGEKEFIKNTIYYNLQLRYGFEVYIMNKILDNSR